MTQKLPPLASMMSKLIGIPSVSSTIPRLDQSNLAMVETLATWLDDLGFRTEIANVPGKPGKANLIAALGHGDGGLVLAGHSDTVPFDEDLWDQDPFEMSDRDGRWYGLGTCDMKGFFPLAIEAASRFRESELSHPLIILATADEESSMSGARALTSASLCGARAAVIGEPTSLTPIWQTKGIMMLRISVTGTSGHSSNPELGKSALDAMPSILDALMEYRAELRRNVGNPAFAVTYPTMNLGCINGGSNPNRICDQVEIQIDVRLLPGMDNQHAKRELHELLEPIANNLGLGLTLEQLHDPVSPFTCDRDSELLSKTESILGRERSTAAFASEAPFMQELGMDTILLGPGSIDQAHQPNEYLESDQLAPTIDIIGRLIHHYCSS